MIVKQIIFLYMLANKEASKKRRPKIRKKINKSIASKQNF